MFTAMAILVVCLVGWLLASSNCWVRWCEWMCSVATHAGLRFELSFAIYSAIPVTRSTLLWCDAIVIFPFRCPSEWFGNTTAMSEIISKAYYCYSFFCECGVVCICMCENNQPAELTHNNYNSFFYLFACFVTLTNKSKFYSEEYLLHRHESL